MPARLAHKFTRPKEIKAREFNDMVRQCLGEAAYYWLRNFQLKHYEPGAAQRYQMPARSESYRRRRAARARARGEEPSNLVWTGQARALARMRANFPPLARVVARSTSNKQYVRIPLVVGHAVNPRLATDGGSNDFGKLIDEEVAAMNRVAMDEMERQMYERWKQKETVTIGAAA